MKNSIRNFKIQAVMMLALLMVVGLVSCKAKHDRSPETYILPEGYVGAFYILYGATNGKAGVEVDGVRIYEIPNTGVLLTQANANEGWIQSDKINFYYRRASGELVKIEERWTGSLNDTADHRTDKKLMIFGGGLGEIQRDADSCRIMFQGFHIGTKKNILDETNHFSIEEVIKQNHVECQSVKP